MAQSADSEPTHDRSKAPATPPDTIQHDQTSPPDNASSNKLPPSNPAPEPQISGPEVSSVTNPTLDSSSSSSILQGTATGTAVEDKEDMWLAMAMTFDDFYQSVPEESEPPLTKTNELNILEPKSTDKLGLSPGANDFRPDEFRCLFSTPFACGFRREVNIDQAGGMTISYIAPDRITWLESRTAMEMISQTRHYIYPL